MNIVEELRGHRTFYITGAGIDEALMFIRRPESNPHDTYHDVLTFIATSGDIGVTPEYYVREFGGDIDDVERVMGELFRDKLITYWKTGRSKRLDDFDWDRI